MSLPHFYLDSQVIAEEGEAKFVLRLSHDDAKHAHVLRLSPGEHIAVVDAVQDYFECEVISCDDALPIVRIARRFEPQDGKPTVVLVQGLAKGDKMETVVRHATELGVSGFIPLMCERCVVKLDAKKIARRTERWRAVAKSAAMQSGQLAVPEVSEPVSLEQVCSMFSQATALLICWEEADVSLSLEDALTRGLIACSASERDARIAAVVGPEGGLTQREVDALLACNRRASLVSLGPSILRTETAGIVAPALVLYELARMDRDTVSLEKDLR